MPRSRPLSSLFALCALAAAAFGCGDAKSVTGPSTTTSSAMIAGGWSGTFTAYDSACGSSKASATFEQAGDRVTGILSTSSCGVSGAFTGTVQGNQLLGSIKMDGCTGGGVSGTIRAGEFTLVVGDLTKPLVTGDRVIMTGGAIKLSR